MSCKFVFGSVRKARKENSDNYDDNAIDSVKSNADGTSSILRPPKSKFQTQSNF